MVNLSRKKIGTTKNENVKDQTESLNNEAVKTGLSSAAAKAKLEQYGFNEIPEKKANRTLQFAKKFWGLSAWMLEIIIALPSSCKDMQTPTLLRVFSCSTPS